MTILSYILHIYCSEFKNQILNVGNPSEPINIKSLVKKISSIMLKVTNLTTDTYKDT